MYMSAFIGNWWQLNASMKLLTRTTKHVYMLLQCVIVYGSPRKPPLQYNKHCRHQSGENSIGLSSVMYWVEVWLKRCCTPNWSRLTTVTSWIGLPARRQLVSLPFWEPVLEPDVCSSCSHGGAEDEHEDLPCPHRSKTHVLLDAMGGLL